MDLYPKMRTSSIPLILFFSCSLAMAVGIDPNDSLVVQELLDSNGISSGTATVQSVVYSTTANGRINHLILESMHIRKIPDSFGSLDSLQMLSLYRNDLFYLPAPGWRGRYCGSPQQIHHFFVLRYNEVRQGESGRGSREG